MALGNFSCFENVDGANHELEVINPVNRFADRVRAKNARPVNNLILCYSINVSEFFVSLFRFLEPVNSVAHR